MGSPQEAALRHRLSSIRAVVESFETELPAASPMERPDSELLIRFFKDAEQNAKNEIELHKLTHGGIDARKQACTHPERHITNAPAPPSVIGDRTPRGPRLTREELIEKKKTELELELRKAESRSSELKTAIEDWHLRGFPEWDRVTANTRTRWKDSQRLAIEQYGALKLHHEQMLASLVRAAVPENGEPEGIPESAVSGSSQKGGTEARDSPDRPFLWSEVDSIARERTTQFDATIRTEIGRPKAPVPENGADRHQFFLLLEEKANLWADRARDVYEDCLKEIGRDSSVSARSSVYHNGLSFFLSDNLLHFLQLACGCVVERPYTVRRPGQPRTYTTIEVPRDVGVRLSRIINAVRSRVEKQFTRNAIERNWFNQMNALLKEIRSDLGHSEISVIPSPVPESTSVRAFAANPPIPDYELSEGGRTVWILGEGHSLTPYQAKMMPLLIKDYETEHRRVSAARLGKAIGTESSNPRNSWRDSPLWNKYVHCERGEYFLTDPKQMGDHPKTTESPPEDR